MKFFRRINLSILDFTILVSRLFKKYQTRKFREFKWRNFGYLKQIFPKIHPQILKKFGELGIFQEYFRLFFFENLALNHPYNRGYSK